jgi:hypothetical protein
MARRNLPDCGPVGLQRLPKRVPPPTWHGRNTVAKRHQVSSGIRQDTFSTRSPDNSSGVTPIASLGRFATGCQCCIGTVPNLVENESGSGSQSYQVRPWWRGTERLSHACHGRLSGNGEVEWPRRNAIAKQSVDVCMGNCLDSFERPIVQHEEPSVEAAGDDTFQPLPAGLCWNDSKQTSDTGRNRPLDITSCRSASTWVGA